MTSLAWLHRMLDGITAPARAAARALNKTLDALYVDPWTEKRRRRDAHIERLKVAMRRTDAKQRELQEGWSDDPYYDGPEPDGYWELERKLKHQGKMLASALRRRAAPGDLDLAKRIETGWWP